MFRNPEQLEAEVEEFISGLEERADEKPAAPQPDPSPPPQDAKPRQDATTPAPLRAIGQK